MQTRHLSRCNGETEPAEFSCNLLTVVCAQQEDLALRLADILLSLSPKARPCAASAAAPRKLLVCKLVILCMLQVAFLYFTVFLSTMRREWFGIDRLRLDKFMMLVRKFTRSLFQYLQAQQW